MGLRDAGAGISLPLESRLYDTASKAGNGAPSTVFKLLKCLSSQIQFRLISRTAVRREAGDGDK